jgi:hypothetical protein
MDIDTTTPPHSQIKAFFFDTYRTFNMFDQELELRLCLGITTPELQYKIEHGSPALLASLKAGGVYPYTDLERTSVPLNV